MTERREFSTRGHTMAKRFQPGDSTASEDDTEEPMYTGRDMVSDSDVGIPWPTKM